LQASAPSGCYSPFPVCLLRQTLAPSLALAALGALLPDLDASESKVKYLQVGGIRPFAPFSILAHRDLGHRGLLHSPYMLMGVGLLAAGLSVWWGWLPSLALWLGYASHLALDGCTRSGISQRPIHNSRLHLLPLPLRLVTGSLAEDLVFVLLAASAMMLLFQHCPLDNWVHPDSCACFTSRILACDDWYRNTCLTTRNRVHDCNFSRPKIRRYAAKSIRRCSEMEKKCLIHPC